jgi:hypothetical protein
MNQVRVPPGGFPIELRFFVHVSLMGGQGEHVLELFLDDPYSEQSIRLHRDTVALRTPMMVQEHLNPGGTCGTNAFAAGERTHQTCAGSSALDLEDLELFAYTPATLAHEHALLAAPHDDSGGRRLILDGLYRNHGRFPTT